jgi:hypothetical protein
MVAAAISANTVLFIAAPFQFFLILQQAANGKVSSSFSCCLAAAEFNVHERRHRPCCLQLGLRHVSALVSIPRDRFTVPKPTDVGTRTTVIACHIPLAVRGHAALVQFGRDLAT